MTGCVEQLVDVKDGSDTLNSYSKSTDLNEDERSIVQDFADSNAHDQTIAHYLAFKQTVVQAAGDIFTLEAGALARTVVTPGGEAKLSWDTVSSRADGDFGYLNQPPVPLKENINFYVASDGDYCA